MVLEVRAWLTAALTLVALLVSAPAAAQVLVFETRIQGDVKDSDGESLRTGLLDALRQTAGVAVLSESETAAILGDGAKCDAPACAVEAGRKHSAQVGVAVVVRADAEIYDFEVRVYSLTDGKVLNDSPGDCTFCPFAEAVDAVKGVASSALRSSQPFPAATKGPEVAVAKPEPKPEPEVKPEVKPEPAAPAARAFEPGAIQIQVSATPATAEIRINGQVVGVGTASVAVAPQKLEFTVLAADHTEHREVLVVEATGPQSVFLRFRLAPSGMRPMSAEAFDQTALGGVLTGVGAAVLIGGVVVLFMDGESACSEGTLAQCPEVYETTGLGAALTTVGALAAGTGIGFIIASSGSEESPSARGETLRFGMTPGRFTIGGSF